MKFGILKSKIEQTLFESYVDKTLKKDIFVFEELILKNKNLSKLFYLYDELSSNLGLNESLASELIDKSISLKSKPNDVFNENNWYGALYYSVIPVKSVKKNTYTLI